MVINMYVTLMPVILAGVSNMIFVKTRLYRRYARPLDGERYLKDGKRVLGNNKTGIGFCSMIVFAALLQGLWGAVCLLPFMRERNAFYIVNENTMLFNLGLGALLGFAYMLFELPNSFIKRRLSIADGKTVHGIKGLVFFVVDQVDSIFGVVFVLAAFAPLTAAEFWYYVLLGGATHIAVNLVLVSLKIRRNI